jgi:hypothetical protein
MSDENKNQGNQTPGDGGQGNQGSKQPDKTFTQAELDAIIADRLQREREKTKDYADLKKAAEEYQKLKDAQMTETEKLKSKLEEAEREKAKHEQQAANLKLEIDKLAILEELGLSKTWANRVKGATVEEIKQDAEELKKALGATGKPVGGGTNPPGAGGGEINPWKRETFNLTKQAQIVKDNPALAQRLMAEAK